MSGKEVYRLDDLTLDVGQARLSRGQEEIALPKLSFDLLLALVRAAPNLLSLDELMNQVWPGLVVSPETVTHRVKSLRDALGDDAKAPRYVVGLRGRGYRIALPVERVEDDHSEAEADQTKCSVAADTRPAVDGRGAACGSRRESAPTADDSGRRGRAGLRNCVLVGEPPPASPAAPPAKVLVAAPLPDHTVAVLPFENLSAEPDNEFLALGISEMVMHRLAAARHLTVIARTSAYVFKDRNEDARSIGRKLNARYLVEGSVQRAGERLRVTAELIDATSGAHVWSFNFDRQIVDLFALQDEISSKVADALSVSLSANTASAEGTSKLDAFLAYMQGLALLNTYKVADAEAAAKHFRRATEIDPQYAAAYAQEGRAIDQVLWITERSDPVAAARAAALNDKALALDPSLGEAWVQRAMLQKDTSKDAALTEREFRKGLALAPNYGQGFAEFSNFLFDLKRTDEGLVMIDRAREVDPLAPRNHYLKGTYLWELGRDDEQVAALFLQALSINPNYHAALARLGQLRFSHGEFAEGVKFLERALAIDPHATWVRVSAVRAYLHMGDLAAALDVANDEKGPPPPAANICILSYRGDWRGAAALARAMLKSGFSDGRPMTERCMAASIRDEALATKKYAPALEVLAERYGVNAGALGEYAETSYIWGLAYAQVLRANGEEVRATQLARAVLASIDRVINDRGPSPEALYWRAMAQAILGDSNAAMTSLESAVHRDMVWGWWMIDQDPAFAGLKQDARYQAIIAHFTDLARKQAALAAEMRKRHELRQRPRAG